MFKAKMIKALKKVWNLFKVNDENTKTVSMNFLGERLRNMILNKTASNSKDFIVSLKPDQDRSEKM